MEKVTRLTGYFLNSIMVLLIGVVTGLTAVICLGASILVFDWDESMRHLLLLVFFESALAN